MTKFRKAYTAAGVATAGALGTALINGHLSLAELLAALGVGLVAGAGVYSVKNADELEGSP